MDRGTWWGLQIVGHSSSDLAHAQEKLSHKNDTLVLCDDIDGGWGRVGGRQVQEGGDMCII